MERTEAVKRAQKKYYQKNIEKWRKHNRDYSKKNPEAHRKRCYAWVKKNPDRVKEIRLKFNSQPDRRVYTRIKNRLRVEFLRQFTKSINENINFQTLLDSLKPYPDFEFNEIDHIIPIREFKFINVEELIKSTSKENLRWLSVEQHKLKTQEDKSKYKDKTILI